MWWELLAITGILQAEIATAAYIISMAALAVLVSTQLQAPPGCSHQGCDIHAEVENHIPCQGGSLNPTP